MAGDLDYGEETYRGYQFLEEMIYFMISEGLEEYRLKRRDVPLDLSVFPFEIARYDKILKVLDMSSRAYEGQVVRYFNIVEPETGEKYLFSYRPDPAGEGLLFTMVDA